MTASTILTLANGKGVDLLAPKFDASDFDALAEHLAKEKRFNGATAGVEYSVAEHCCLGADAILAHPSLSGIEFEKQIGRAIVAGYFLLHDMHEAIWKDDTTPKKSAIAEIAQSRFGILAQNILDAQDIAVAQIDVAIHEAAGLPWPAPKIVRDMVKRWDKIMFVTEWRDYMGDREHPDWLPYYDVPPLKQKLFMPWSWRTAKAAWLGRAQHLLPALALPNSEAAA
jgi:uncharacterized protein